MATHVLQRPISVFAVVRLFCSFCWVGRMAKAGVGCDDASASLPLAFTRSTRLVTIWRSLYSEQSAGQLALVSRYGEEEHSGKADVPVFFHGAGHYDLLVRQQPMLPPVSRL